MGLTWSTKNSVHLPAADECMQAWGGLGALIQYILFPGSPVSKDRVKVSTLRDQDNNVIGLEYAVAGAQISDSGTFECRAQNEQRTDSQQVQISVVQPPATTTGPTAPPAWSLNRSVPYAFTIMRSSRSPPPGASISHTKSETQPMPRLSYF